ncbi:hypothetical protein FXF50_04580 [Micromonospora sp. AP08]|nr:hypothetical protein FXF50_04580 [Micromonospora sp. AP08]
MTPAGAQAFAAHMLFEMARMSRDDGLVVRIHPGVAPRSRSRDPRRHRLRQRFHIPIAIELTRALRPRSAPSAATRA